MKYKNISSISALLLLNKTIAQNQVEINPDGTSIPLIKKQKTNKDLLMENKRKLAMNCFKKLVEFEKNNNTVLEDASFSYLLRDNILENESIDKSAYCRFPIIPPHLPLKNPLIIIDLDKDKTIINAIEKYKKNSVGKTDDEKIKLINNHAIEFFNLAGNNFNLKKPESGTILLGDFPNKYQALCVQFSLFTKILCDELNTDSVKCSVVKGYYGDAPHAWNEITKKNSESEKTDKFLFDIAQQNILLKISKSNKKLKNYKKNNSNNLIKNENELYDMFHKNESSYDQNLYQKQFNKLIKLYQTSAYN